MVGAGAWCGVQHISPWPESQWALTWHDEGIVVLIIQLPEVLCRSTVFFGSVSQVIFIRSLSLRLTFALSVKTPVCLAKDKQEDSRVVGPNLGPGSLDAAGCF